MDLINLPDIVLMHIFSFMSYDEVAQKRIVCKKFDHICGKVLNRGYFQVELYHRKVLKEFKALLPRRESGRRSHPLARHCDLLVAIETRLSMLSMTFIKHMELNQCCFIPGKVIDETWNVLRLLTSVDPKSSLPRTQEALQELRDLSSMAMEHFDDKIAPALKQKSAVTCDSPVPIDLLSPQSEIKKLRLQNVKLRKQILNCARENKLRKIRDIRLQKKLDLSTLKIDLLCKKISHFRKFQNSVNTSLLARIKHQENEMNELKQRIPDPDNLLKDASKSQSILEDVSSSNNSTPTTSSSSSSLDLVKRRRNELEFRDDFLESLLQNNTKKKKKDQ